MRRQAGICSDNTQQIAGIVIAVALGIERRIAGGIRQRSGQAVGIITVTDGLFRIGDAADLPVGRLVAITGGDIIAVLLRQHAARIIEGGIGEFLPAGIGDLDLAAGGIVAEMRGIAIAVGNRRLMIHGIVLVAAGIAAAGGGEQFPFRAIIVDCKLPLKISNYQAYQPIVRG